MEEELMEELRWHGIDSHPVVNGSIKLAREFHLPIMREDGRSQLTAHIFHAAKLYLESLRAENQRADPLNVAKILLHDSKEIEIQQREKRDTYMRTQLSRYGTRSQVDEIMSGVDEHTKPPEYEFNGKSKAERKRMRDKAFDAQFSLASPDAQRRRLADRLSNLMSPNVNDDRRRSTARSSHRYVEIAHSFPFFRTRFPTALKIFTKPPQAVRYEIPPWRRKKGPVYVEEFKRGSLRYYNGSTKEHDSLPVRIIRGKSDTAILLPFALSENSSAFIRDNWLTGTRQYPQTRGMRGNVSVKTAAEHGPERDLLYKPIPKEAGIWDEVRTLLYLRTMGLRTETPLGVYIDRNNNARYLITRALRGKYKLVPDSQLREFRGMIRKAGFHADRKSFNRHNVLWKEERGGESKPFLVGAWKLRPRTDELARLTRVKRAKTTWTQRLLDRIRRV